MSADPLGDTLTVLRDGAGRPYAQADVLPDLPQVQEHGRRLPGLVVLDTMHQPATRKTSGEWMLVFTYQGHRFGVHTNYHAWVSLFSAEPDCPDPLLREVITHFANCPVVPNGWVPPPALDGRRMLLLFLVALAVAVPLAVFLVLFRKG